jgi:hypothetical protein
MGERGKLPKATDSKATGPKAKGKGEVAAFLDRLASVPAPGTGGARGRLLFGIDATASRQPTWDRACEIQAEMFHQAAALGGLEIQLAYYRGFHEFAATEWLDRADELTRRMTAVTCLAGRTQIGALLDHVIAEARRRRVNAFVFVGDCMEEDAEALYRRAGELAILGLPAFVFHEGGEPLAAESFQRLARLSGGAYCRFDAGSAKQLRELLRAVAVFAAGGRAALDDYGRRRGGAALRIERQMKGR